MNRRFAMATLAYLVPTFVIAYAWHLVIFAERYHALAIYRADLIVPFGFVAVLTQAVLFAAAYPRVFGAGPILSNGFKYGVSAGLLSWTYTTLAVAAKFPMTSITDYLVIESAFTVAQFAVVGPLTAWAYRSGADQEAVTHAVASA